ncbi:UDP-N-acetylmuramoyl-tripeptide--D-alanyl-D-alanine ligase [Candidatus Margulisiibacteriota bacterium]
MDVSIDTREIKPGQYFIPVKGEKYDGHQFIDEAVKKGARILDVDIGSYAAKYRKKLSCSVLAITGSAGKTTTKDLLYSILKEKYKVIKTLENQNNEIGVPLTILRADFNTEILILELAMRNKREISYLTQIARPTHVVVTNIGSTHIKILGSKRKIAEAKSEIFRKRLKTEKYSRYSFLNSSSPYYNFLRRRAQNAGYGIFPFSGQDKPDQNINLCYVLGRHFGLTTEEITKGLGNYQQSAHRFTVIKTKEVTIIDDAYNANPDGVKFALQSLKRFEGRKILVLGDMLELGDYSAKEHLNVLPMAMDANVALIFTFGKEVGVIIGNENMPVNNYFDKKTLHEALLAELKAGDVVLVKGSRGMKMEETVEEIKRFYA